MKISIICVYNCEENYQNQLLSSISLSNSEIEIIGINNCKNKFSSAANALNVGAKQATGDIYIFAHQDVSIKEKDGLLKFSKTIQELPTGTIVGGAGAKEKVKVNIGNYTSGNEFNPEIIYNINELEEVSCIDEALFGMKKETFESHSFDERLCDNWHLYAVEMCLYQRKHRNKIYVYPIQFHHYSYGKINKKYVLGLIKLSNNYRPYFKYIWTTCYKVSTSYIYYCFFIIFLHFL